MNQWMDESMSQWIRSESINQWINGFVGEVNVKPNHIWYTLSILFDRICDRIQTKVKLNQRQKQRLMSWERDSNDN